MFLYGLLSLFKEDLSVLNEQVMSLRVQTLTGIQPGSQNVSDVDGCRQLTTSTKLMFKTSYTIVYTSYKNGLYIISILFTKDLTVRDQSMQYEYVAADVLQSCS